MNALKRVKYLKSIYLSSYRYNQCFNHMNNNWTSSCHTRANQVNNINITQEEHHQVAPPFSVNNRKLQRVASVLSQYQYDEIQIKSIFDNIGDLLMNESRVNDSTIQETIECWLSNLKPPNLNPKMLDKLVPEDVDYDMAATLQTVTSQIEPKLLLMKPESIETRLNEIMELGILNGRRDLWRVFVYAPMGWYLQDWTQFMRKFHYLQSIVIDWLIDKKEWKRLTLHPLIRNAKVLELSYENIKCRHLFALRTGLKSVSITNTLSKVTAESKVDLRALMMTDLETYLKMVAPHCRIEEFQVFQQIISEQEDGEEEKIINELAELKNMKHDLAGKLVKKSFITAANKSDCEIIELQPDNSFFHTKNKP